MKDVVLTKLENQFFICFVHGANFKQRMVNKHPTVMMTTKVLEMRPCVLDWDRLMKNVVMPPLPPFDDEGDDSIDRGGVGGSEVVGAGDVRGSGALGGIATA